MRIVKPVSIAKKMNRDGSKRWMTTYRLRGTLVTSLFESGHSDTSVSNKTSHRDLRSSTLYQNLRGGEGKRQQRDIIGYPSNESSKRSYVRYPNCNPTPAEPTASVFPNSVQITDIGNFSGNSTNINFNKYTAPSTPNFEKFRNSNIS